MGIDYHNMKFLEWSYRQGGSFGDTLTLGRQELAVAKRHLQSYLGVSDRSAADRFAGHVLREAFGATQVLSLDASPYDGAEVIHDLNIPTSSQVETFDTIIDAGTLEHVFDVKTAFANVARMCAPGGQILHMLPANNLLGHGFYQFSPEFFFNLYGEQHGFRETRVFLASLGRDRRWWAVDRPTLGQRVEANGHLPTYALVRTVKTYEASGVPNVQQSDYQTMWTGRDQVGSADSAWRKRLKGVIPQDQRTQFVRKVMLLQWRARRGMNALNPSIHAERPPGSRRS